VPKKSSLALALVALASVLTACGGNSGTARMTCGPAPLEPIPAHWLIYPAPNATDVPDSIGELVFAGLVQSGDSVGLATAGGASVPAGPFTAAPSPLPTPYATPPSSGIPLAAAPLPVLSPGTTYAVGYTYTTWADNPPVCKGPATQPLGSFTTR
jgi:hypothetical protein